jgi:hypothetical protein
LAAEKNKKKDTNKKRTRKKMVARDTLEKCRRAQAMEGLPLEASASMDDDDDDDDDEGMEVRLGFSLEARLWSESASVGPSGGADVPAQGSTASLSEARVSVEPDPVPAAVDEAGAMEERAATPLPATRPVEEKADVSLQVPVTGRRGLRSLKPRVDVDVVPRSG